MGSGSMPALRRMLGVENDCAQFSEWEAARQECAARAPRFLQEVGNGNTKAGGARLTFFGDRHSFLVSPPAQSSLVWEPSAAKIPTRASHPSNSRDGWERNARELGAAIMSAAQKNITKIRTSLFPGWDADAPEVKSGQEKCCQASFEARRPRDSEKFLFRRGSIHTRKLPLKFQEDAPSNPSPSPVQADSGSVPSTTAGQEEKGASSANGGGEQAEVVVPATGPVFMGQIYTLCDSSRDGLCGVRFHNLITLGKILEKLPPFVQRLAEQWVEKKNMESIKVVMSTPLYRFFLNKRNAANYVEKLQTFAPDLALCACPLDKAYKFFKQQPPLFEFVPDEEQVIAARSLLLREQGMGAATSFRGVPVFSASNLSFALATSKGVQWFTPYFFDKRQLDHILRTSVNLHYQNLLQNRRLQRRIAASSTSSPFPPSLGGTQDELSSDFGEDDPDALVDPPEVQEFMEQIGHGVEVMGPPDLFLMRAVELVTLDCLDSVLLGSRWGRQLAGLQPRFNVTVDSFERRVAAAEVETRQVAGNTPAGKAEAAGTLGVSSPVDSRNIARPGPGSVGATSSSTDATASPVAEAHKNFISSKPADSLRAPNSSAEGGPLLGLRRVLRRLNPFSHRGWRPGERDNTVGGERPEAADGKHGAAQPVGEANPRGDPVQADEEENWRAALQWHGMLGVAPSAPGGGAKNDSFQHELAVAARDLREKVRRGECLADCHGSLFIADLGEAPSLFPSDGSIPSGQGGDGT